MIYRKRQTMRSRNLSQVLSEKKEEKDRNWRGVVWPWTKGKTPFGVPVLLIQKS